MSHRFIATCHCRFLASFLKEKHGKKIPLSTLHCNQLQHTRSACFKIFQTTFDSILFKSLLSHAGQLSWRQRGRVAETRDFQLQTMQLLEASCLFSFKSILSHTSEKCQCQMNSVCVKLYLCSTMYKWYLRLKISAQAPFKSLSCFYFRCVLSSQWKAVTVNLLILHCQLWRHFWRPIVRMCLATSNNLLVL